eukprot:Phypoly_transcript_13083.p1 GENE.Phypoly_transcript_13083~~Phypoly_transcript_13083.p1  ORF type:complete len:337 (+),score=48.01 Phypoly_transcript_13083:66-1013(+)
MALPIDGALYYLHHVSSNKYVHALGGSDVPGDNTPLVFHEPGGRLALQFYFTTDAGGHRQLRHYGSGKYVHPRGGEVGNNVTLVIHSDSDGPRTSLKLIEFEGRTYLASGSKPSFYVHPLGGSDQPGNDTELVFFQESRPSLAIALVPAEEYTIVGISYDQKAISTLASSEVIVDKVITNNTDTSSTSTVELKYSRSVNNTVTFSFTETLGIKISNKFQSNLLVAGSEVAVEASFEFSATQTTSTSTTNDVSVGFTETVTVPAHTTIKVSLITTRSSGKIPFTANVKSSRGQVMDIKGVADCEFFINQKVIQNKV